MLGTKRKPINTLIGGIHTSAANRPYTEVLLGNSSLPGTHWEAANTLRGWMGKPCQERHRQLKSTVHELYHRCRSALRKFEPRIFLGEGSSGKGIVPEYLSPQKAVQDSVHSSQLKHVMIFQSIHQLCRHKPIISTWQRHKAPFIYYHSSGFRNSFSCY